MSEFTDFFDAFAGVKGDHSKHHDPQVPYDMVKILKSRTAGKVKKEAALAVGEFWYMLNKDTASADIKSIFDERLGERDNPGVRVVVGPDTVVK